MKKWKNLIYKEVEESSEDEDEDESDEDFDFGEPILKNL